ncbi:hypothetical protein K470DRAFT_256833 [Piedraia hortae CBS 480.64]|uniref:Pre-mRNA-splicing factor SLU7 n=1 Tax=Piedraia hortae CBS 480.64 TaxID=1314780 RepID=A0A6A7C1K1_9PEZI|nr:hypothetical protein K470DRAFT_256833 [Piedraia hortae CBS 480.64]
MSSQSVNCHPMWLVSWWVDRRQARFGPLASLRAAPVNRLQGKIHAPDYLVKSQEATSGMYKTSHPDEADRNNERNEYIPSFIAKKPFYVDDATQSQDDYLEHQRLQSQKNHDPIATSAWYQRGVSTGTKATKFRKGACENCGAMGHKEKDCLQRKRKRGARWTGRDIAEDREAQNVNLGWNAKRDRWNGFEASDYQDIVGGLNVANEEEAGDKYEANDTDVGRQKAAASTRALRLREDTAKYLLNLDADGEDYDPKTRSMADKPANESLADEGFQRESGDAAEFERAQRYAWETQKRDDADTIHLQANPTEAQIKRKRKADEDLRKAAEKKKALIDKYGDQSAVRAKPTAIPASNDVFVEYDEHGRIKGQKEAVQKSMYPQDVLINNHTAVWGSWWKDFKWGYKCCHSIVKNSFCTGETGKLALAEAEEFSRLDRALGDEDDQEERKQV